MMAAVAPASSAPLPPGVPLDLTQRARIEAALLACHAESGAAMLSDLVFSNLYLFRAAHDYRLLEGDWPLIAGHTYDGSRHAIPLFDLALIPASVLAQILAQHGCLYPLSKQQVAQLDPHVFEAVAARDDADYLYAADNFRHYRGTRLLKKRNLMKQFLSNHAVRSVALDASVGDDARAVLAGWMLEKGKGQGEADELPCLEALAHLEEFGLQGFLHYADGAPAGFVLSQEISSGVFVMRFAKGLARYKGIAQYMFHHFVSAAPQTVQWLNFEQDMGLANFRKTKLSYQPTALIDKYRVRLRAGRRHTGPDPASSAARTLDCGSRCYGCLPPTG